MKSNILVRSMGPFSEHRMVKESFDLLYAYGHFSYIFLDEMWFSCDRTIQWTATSDRYSFSLSSEQLHYDNQKFDANFWTVTNCRWQKSWQDRRLAFNGPIETLSLSIKMLEGIWKPDTFIYNGKKSYLHTITTPNKLLRINKDGSILYSVRLVAKSSYEYRYTSVVDAESTIYLFWLFFFSYFLDRSICWLTDCGAQTDNQGEMFDGSKRVPDGSPILPADTGKL